MIRSLERKSLSDVLTVSLIKNRLSMSLRLPARVYAKRGDVGKAIAEYERLYNLNTSIGASYLVHPLYHYRLGFLYKKSGEIAKAKTQYQKFLDLWKDADPDLPEVEDAKARLKALL